jgi:hypothetical protein
MRETGPVTYMEEKTNACWVLVGKTEGKRPFKRSRCRSECDAEEYKKEVLWDGMDWIRLDQDTVVAIPFVHSNESLGSKMQEFLD